MPLPVSCICSVPLTFITFRFPQTCALLPQKGSNPSYRPL